MKKTLLLTLLGIFSLGAFCQEISTLNYSKWSDPDTYKLSPSPSIKGYGFYSDSLSEAFDGKTFFEYNNEFYCIESWADYYYWFTKQYNHIFEDPQLYEYYYLSNDDYGMASYIASNKYLGKYYPSSINLNFDNHISENRLSNDSFIARSEKEIEVLRRKLKKSTAVENNEIKHEAPMIFEKEKKQKSNIHKNNNSNNKETFTSPDANSSSKSKMKR